MSLTAAAIRFLAEKGLSALDIAEMAEMMQPVRSPNAERQQRYRDNGGGRIPDDLRQSVFERDGYECLDCGALDNLCCDHVIPVSKGGTTDFENLQTLCIPCNSRKKDRIRKRDTRRVRGKSVEVSSDISDATPFPAPPKDNNQTPPTHTPVNILPARKGPDFPMLDCVDPALWADFLKNRKAKRLPNTASAHKRLVEDLEKTVAMTGWPPGEVFRRCVEKGWGAIYDPRDEGKKNGNTGRTSNNSGGNGRTIDGFAKALRYVADGPLDEPFGFDRGRM